MAGDIDYDALARRALAQAEAPQAAPDTGLGPLSPDELGDLDAPPERSWLQTLGGVGKGAIMGVVDVMDRPGRVLRRLYGGHYGEAAKALIPFSGSDWYTGGDLLRDLDVPEGRSLGVLGSTRAVGGFAIEMATDPLMWFGGALGKGLQKGTSAVSSRSMHLLEGVAGVGAAGAARSGLEKAGRVLGQAGSWKGAAVGGALGAGLEALDPEGNPLQGLAMGASPAMCYA